MLLLVLQNIFKVLVTEDQMSLILTTLRYQGVLENAHAIDDEEVWQLAGYEIPHETAFTSFPCGICPVHFLSVYHKIS